MGKTYAGARLRRLREERRMSQAELARVLGISPSYLNQMEHDSRPLTVPVLLKLTEAFGVDPGFFSERDTTRLVADLREALAGEITEDRVSASDLADLASRMPAVAAFLLDLGRRNQALTERLAGAADGRDGTQEAPARPTRRSGTSSTVARTTFTTPTSRPSDSRRTSASGPARWCGRSPSGSPTGTACGRPPNPAIACITTTRRPALSICRAVCDPVSGRSGWRPSSPCSSTATNSTVRPPPTFPPVHRRTRWPGSASPTTSPPR